MIIIIAGVPMLFMLPLVAVVAAAAISSSSDGNNEDSSSSCSAAILELGGIPSKDVKRSAVAARLSELVGDLHKDDDDDDDDDDNGNNDDPYNYLAVEDFGVTEQEQEQEGIYYESGVDAVYTVRVNNEYCVAAFRGTTNFMIQDWFSNLYVGPVVFNNKTKTNTHDDDDVNKDEDSEDSEYDDENNIMSMCDMHRGYHDAYFNFEYRASVEDFLRNCKADCSDCDVVLTGHSQGGGIAEIASLYLHDDDRLPDNFYVITFGAPQSLGAGCQEIFNVEERCRWYHYIMATEGPLGRGLVYDPIPMLYSQFLDNPTNGDNNDGDGGDGGDNNDKENDQTYARNGGLAYIGHEIIVSSDDPSSVIYVGFDEHRFVDLTKIDATGSAHYDTLYVELLERQSELVSSTTTFDDNNVVVVSEEGDTNNCTGSYCQDHFLPSTGFSVGSLCNTDEDTCVEGTECGNDQKDSWFGSWKNTCQQQEQLLVTTMTSAAAAASTTSSASSSSAISSVVAGDNDENIIITLMTLNSSSALLRQVVVSSLTFWSVTTIVAAFTTF